MNVRFVEKFVLAIKPPTDEAQAYYWDEDVAGLCLVVGRTGAKTFMYRGRVAGKRVKIRIGPHRGKRPDGREWTVELARQRARELLVDFARGVNPMAKAAPAATGPTLRDGVEVHLARMKKKQRAASSLRTFEYETAKYLATWLDRPIAELTGAKLVEIHDRIKRVAGNKANRNEANEKGAPLANRVVTHVSAAWNSLNKKLEGGLGTWNPAKAVDKDVIKPKRERLTDLVDWAARVATMKDPLREDGLMLALFTGLRSEDVRTIRFDNVDWNERTLRLPDPKGGEDAAFTIPLSKTAHEILKRRRDRNDEILLVREAGGHSGWAFPTVNKDGEVGPIGDLRKQTHGDKHGRFPVEDVHTLRRTWESIAHEEGVSELDQHVLSNHSFGSRNVNATYIAQHIDHLAKCAARIDVGLRKRLQSKSK